MEEDIPVINSPSIAANQFGHHSQHALDDLGGWRVAEMVTQLGRQVDGKLALLIGTDESHLFWRLGSFFEFIKSSCNHGNKSRSRALCVLKELLENKIQTVTDGDRW